MALTRATVTLDGNGIPQHENTTTPFVDQNQTYTSHPSHQVFLREYAIDANGDAVSTGKLLDGRPQRIGRRRHRQLGRSQGAGARRCSASS